MELGISEVSQQFGLSIHTLRYYEKEGILPMVKRTESGIRRFDEMAIKGLKMVECLKKSGLPLKDIRRFLEMTQEGDASLEDRLALFRERREVILREMQELQGVLDVIEFKNWYYETAVEHGTEEVVKNIDPEQMPKAIRDLSERIDF